jgi:hypothetical protein
MRRVSRATLLIRSSGIACLLVSGRMTPPAQATPETPSEWGGAPKVHAEPVTKSIPHCPNGKKFFLGTPEQYSGHGAHPVAVADMNGDGKLDIVTGNPDSKAARPFTANVGVMLGKGGGEFGELVLSPVGGDSLQDLNSSPLVLTTGDLNGDHRPDVVFTAPGFGSASPIYLLNNGDGSLGGQTSLHTESKGLPIIVDVNGDKRRDVVVSQFLWTNVGKKKGAKLFLGGVKFNDIYADAEAAADLDGDGAPELVVIKNGSTLMVYGNDGNGSFAKGASYPIPGAKRMATADFNGDGKPDLAVQAQSLAILINQGDGTFAPPAYYSYAGNEEPWYLIASDLNGDGRADLATSTPYKGVGVFMNRGDGKLADPIVLAAGKAGALAAGDFGGEGVQSLVVVEPQHGSDEAHIYVFPGVCR